MDNLELQKKLEELEKKVMILSDRRISQSAVLPGAIKQRHVGEGVLFLRSGIAADRPVAGESTSSGSAFYWATDTFVLSGWTGTAWKSVTLT